MTQVITVSGGIPQPQGECQDCRSYASVGQINRTFGKQNVQRWADLDNDDNQGTIQARCDWALCLATNTLDSKLLGGVYAVPFVAPVPCIIQDLCARLAGCLLYDARRIADKAGSDEDPPTYSTQPHRLYVKTACEDIRAGRMRLPIAQVGTTVPMSAFRALVSGRTDVGSNTTPQNVDSYYWLPFIWAPVVIYPPVFSPWPSCGGGLMSWW